MACPLWPLHYIVIYLLSVCPLWAFLANFASGSPSSSGKPRVEYYSEIPQAGLVEGDHATVHYAYTEPLGAAYDGGTLQVVPKDPGIATIIENQTIPLPGERLSLTDLVGKNLSFALEGKFLGITEVKVRATSKDNQSVVDSEPLTVRVVRKSRVIDKIFIYSVVILLGLNYINMGASLDLEVVKNTLKRPIGPCVGLFSQFIFMPLIAFGLAYAIFTDSTMRLGLFTAGCSPGGGASNMWTYLLGGNLNLSITMTFFSNILALVMMPVWLFSMGYLIFSDNAITIPYQNIFSFVVVLVIPVGLGLLLQRYAPRIAKFCRRILGPFSFLMIIFIIIFGSYANLYMFKLFTWQVAVAGLGLPWLGYLIGAVWAKLLGFSVPDITAIAVETGVQNTGIPIVLLKLTLPQPEADLTSVIPVAMATMTPWPLLVMYLIRKLMMRGRKDYKLHVENDSPSDEEATIKSVDTANVSRTSTPLPNGTVEGDLRY